MWSDLWSVVLMVLLNNSMSIKTSGHDLLSLLGVRWAADNLALSGVTLNKQYELLMLSLWSLNDFTPTSWQLCSLKHPSKMEAHNSVCVVVRITNMWPSYCWAQNVNFATRVSFLKWFEWTVQLVYFSMATSQTFCKQKKKTINDRW